MRLLLVVADGVRRYAVSMTLQREGYIVVEADSGESALERYHWRDFDLALADTDLPGMDGFQLLAGIKRRANDAVVILMSENASLEDAVAALRAGASDYLALPCGSDELRASVERGLASARDKLRRRRLLLALEQSVAQLTTESGGSDPDHSEVAFNLRDLRGTAPEHGNAIAIGPFLLAPGRHQVSAGDQSASLTPTEFDMLLYLAAHRERIVPCSELVREVRGYHVDEPEAREVIRPHISNLRRKLKALDDTDMIANARGLGYRLSEDLPVD